MVILLLQGKARRSLLPTPILINLKRKKSTIKYWKSSISLAALEDSFQWARVNILIDLDHGISQLGTKLRH